MKPDDCDDLIRIGKHLVSTDVNGPGRRFVIWMQGCCFDCEGCFNPEFKSVDSGKYYPLKEIQQLIKSSTNIEGISLSGGEPLLQAQALLPLLKWAKNAVLSVVCYTGWKMDELLSDDVPYGREVIALCDILIDGRFEASEKAPLLWRGSRNQNIHFLSDRYRSEYANITNHAQKQNTEIIIGNGSIAMTGIFEMDLWDRLQKKLLTRS